MLYGNLNKKGNANQYADYTGGATLADVPSVLNRGGIASTTLLREVLTDPKLDNLTRHFVCAYFNALLGALDKTKFMYILSTQQVLDMATGTIGIPKGAPGSPGDFNAFFESTWT